MLSGDTTGCAASATQANNQFSSANVGTGLTVTANGITLTNNASGNYSLTSTTATTTANAATTAAVTATLTAAGKAYDTTTAEPDASMSCRTSVSSLADARERDLHAIKRNVQSRQPGLAHGDGDGNDQRHGRRQLHARPGRHGHAIDQQDRGRVDHGEGRDGKRDRGQQDLQRQRKCHHDRLHVDRRRESGHDRVRDERDAGEQPVQFGERRHRSDRDGGRNHADEQCVGELLADVDDGDDNCEHHDSSDYGRDYGIVQDVRRDGDGDHHRMLAHRRHLLRMLRNVSCAATNGAFEGATVGAGTVTATVTLSGTKSASNYTLGAAGTALSSSTASVTTDVTADVVYGQSGSFTTNAANQPGLGASSLSAPSEVAFDASGNLYVADKSNNRVLFYPAGSTTATRVYGQGGSFTSNGVNTGGVSADSLNGPAAVALDAGGNLYIADEMNNRVLFYPAGQTTATRVYGQSGNFTTNGSSRGANVMRFPLALALDAGGGLYVSDAGNIRAFSISRRASRPTPTRVYGQGGNFSGATGNYPAGTPPADGLSGAAGLAVDGSGNLYVTDPFNNRVLVYSPGSTTATGVYGQGGSFHDG